MDDFTEGHDFHGGAAGSFADEGCVECAAADEPQEGDLVSTDHLNWFEQGGTGRKPALTVAEGQDHVKALKAYMKRERFWPNAWFISDHGNAHLIDLSR